MHRTTGKRFSQMFFFHPRSSNGQDPSEYLCNCYQYYKKIQLMTTRKRFSQMFFFHPRSSNGQDASEYLCKCYQFYIKKNMLKFVFTI